MARHSCCVLCLNLPDDNLNGNIQFQFLQKKRATVEIRNGNPFNGRIRNEVTHNSGMALSRNWHRPILMMDYAGSITGRRLCRRRWWLRDALCSRLDRGGTCVMPQPNRFDSTELPLAPRRCPLCGTAIFLAWITPSEQDGHDERTFECLTCHYAETLTVKFR